MPFLDEEIERVVRSGVLGRSPVYAKLLAYLKETTEQGKSAKEIDIAVEVFDRSDFDSATDSSVRVYLHNLRQKLKSYYLGPARKQGQIILIPRGVYTLQIHDRQYSLTQSESKKDSLLSVARMTGIAAAALMVGWFAAIWFTPADEFKRAAESPIWQPILNNERPLVVVLGDYCMVTGHFEPLFSSR